MSLTKVSYSMIAGAPVNVLDFGASPSASAAVNTAAIQAAIASEREIIIPEGIYALNPFVIEDITYLTIRGQGKVVLNFTKGNYGIRLGDTAHTKPVRRLILDNIEISASAAISVAIDMQYATDCSFYDVKIQDLASYIGIGFYIKWSWDNNWYNVIVKSLHGFALYDQANENTVFGGRFESTNSANGIGIRVEAGAANAFIGCDVSSWKYGFSIGGASGLTIQGCYFEGNTENDIYFNANAPGSGISITGNFFDDRTTPINAIKQEPAGGVNGTSGVLIQSNSFYGPPLNYFIVMNLNCYYWTVTANSFLYSSNKYTGTTTAVNCVIDDLFGSWVPTYISSGSGTPTTTESDGYWIKQGRLVTAWFQIKGLANGASGSLIIDGLPYKSGDSMNGRGFAGSVSQALDWGTATPKTIQKGVGGNTTIDLYDSNGATIIIGNMSAGDNELVGMVSYYAAV